MLHFTTSPEVQPGRDPNLSAETMTERYWPEGYTTVSPYLIVNGAAETIDFVIRVFDAQEVRRFPREDGRVMHSELRIGDSLVMIADGVPPEWPACEAHVHVYVADVDATYTAALEAGAAAVQAPTQREGDEDRRGGVKDAGGTTWWIASRVR